MAAPSKSLRPKARSKTAVMKSVRPKTRPDDLAAGAAAMRGNRIKELERKEEDMMMEAKRDRVKKMAKGGSCRGMGAAKKGGKYSRMG
ncbi:MAG TPA: hypothetical protein VIG24_07995 [Acidimicrobiia bacterium]